MRTTLTLLFTAAIVGLAPANAQTPSPDDGCVQADPCPWVVDIDATGFEPHVEPELTVTRGDWFELLVFNNDPDRAHTITLSGHAVSITVEADGMSDEAGAFQFATVGDFTLKDMPSGDTIAVHVIEGDSVEAESATGTNTPSKGGPALPFVILAAALVALVAILGPRD